MLRRLSLTSRLTLFFTAVAAILILGLGSLFLSAANRHFMVLDALTLGDKKHLIEDIVSSSHSMVDTRDRLKEALSHHHGLFVMATDTQGQILFQSEGFSPPGAGSMRATAVDADGLHVWQSAGRELHALHFQAHPKERLNNPIDVTVAIDTEHHQRFLSELQHSLGIYALMAMLVSGVLGWLAAHQGLSPLRAMKARAAAVSVHKMDARMPIAAVPIEMADLALELNRMLDRLQQDFHRLSEFSSDLAHELRTPISNLLTQTQVTLSAKRDENRYRDILASNAEELQRLARMVSDMLFLAKTERGVDLPNKENFAVASEVRALVEFYEAVAEEKHIALHDHGEGRIRGDRLMFRRAVSNLLSNALRHTPYGGAVQIRISESAQATDIVVDNTGQAIEPHALPRVFDRFYRVDPARSHPESDGAGLGLSITKAIVEAHGGTVSVASDPGSTRFSLRFPRTDG